MGTRRVLPPSNVQKQTMTVGNGSRTITGTPGNVFDIASFDAASLGANGWLDLFDSGPTSARPVAGIIMNPGQTTTLSVGAVFLDTSINAIIAWDGAAWRNVLTGASV
jgi:hypothetical protein